MIKELLLFCTSIWVTAGRVCSKVQYSTNVTQNGSAYSMEEEFFQITWRAGMGGLLISTSCDNESGIWFPLPTTRLSVFIVRVSIGRPNYYLSMPTKADPAFAPLATVEPLWQYNTSLCSPYCICGFQGCNCAIGPRGCNRSGGVVCQSGYSPPECTTLVPPAVNLTAEGLALTLRTPDDVNKALQIPIALHLVEDGVSVVTGSFNESLVHFHSVEYNMVFQSQYMEFCCVIDRFPVLNMAFAESLKLSDLPLTITLSKMTYKPFVNRVSQSVVIGNLTESTNATLQACMEEMGNYLVLQVSDMPQPVTAVFTLTTPRGPLELSPATNYLQQYSQMTYWGSTAFEVVNLTLTTSGSGAGVSLRAVNSQNGGQQYPIFPSMRVPQTLEGEVTVVLGTVQYVSVLLYSFGEDCSIEEFGSPELAERALLDGRMKNVSNSVIRVPIGAELTFGCLYYTQPTGATFVCPPVRRSFHIASTVRPPDSRYEVIDPKGFAEYGPLLAGALFVLIATTVGALVQARGRNTEEYTPIVH